MKRLACGVIVVLVLAAFPAVALAQGGAGGALRMPITEETFFQLKIPTLELNLPVTEAWMSNRTWEFRVLAEEAGHLQYTAWPGMRGNIVIGGHYELADFEPGPFYALDELALGDRIEVIFMGEAFTYEVAAISLVEPTDLRVIYPTPVEVLTLLTCYDYSPLSASYTHRYVVQALRVP